MIRTLVLGLMLAAAASAAPAAEIGEDGLHKQPWLAVTFKDMTEDLEAAGEQGKRLALIWEQRGCLYCEKLHNEVLSDPEVAGYIQDNFVVVQMNMFGDEEVTDFDSKALPEKEMARRWGVVFTPTVMFMPETVDERTTAAEAAVITMPGAFSKSTVTDMLTWVVEKGYEGEEHFQKYHARKLDERRAAGK